MTTSARSARSRKTAASSKGSSTERLSRNQNAATGLRPEAAALDGLCRERCGRDEHCLSCLEAGELDVVDEHAARVPRPHAGAREDLVLRELEAQLDHRAGQTAQTDLHVLEAA